MIAICHGMLYNMSQRKFNAADSSQDPADMQHTEITVCYESMYQSFH